MLIGGAAVRLIDVAFFQRAAPDVGDGLALGVDRRDVQAAGFDVGDAVGFHRVDRLHHHLPQFNRGVNERRAAELRLEAVGVGAFCVAGGFLRRHALS